MSKVGETRKKTGGRKKGTPNKATASIRDIAREYTQDAVRALVDVLKDEDQPGAARVGAANALLDRGYGKPSQTVGGDDDNPIKVAHVIELVGYAGQD